MYQSAHIVSQPSAMVANACGAKSSWLQAEALAVTPLCETWRRDCIPEEPWQVGSDKQWTWASHLGNWRAWSRRHSVGQAKMNADKTCQQRLPVTADGASHPSFSQVHCTAAAFPTTHHSSIDVEFMRLADGWKWGNQRCLHHQAQGPILPVDQGSIPEIS